MGEDNVVRAPVFVSAALMMGSLLFTSIAMASANNLDARIRVVLSGSATAQGGVPLVRQPRIAEPAGGVLPREAMPKVLAQTGKSLIAWVQASLVINADGTPGTCRPSEAMTTQGAGYHFVTADKALGLEACDMLRERMHFSHALDEAGRPTEAVVAIRIQLEQGDARLPSAPPPPTTLGPGFNRTSGHVTDAAGRLLGMTWVESDYAINPPNWDNALADRRNLPKAATSGVLVDLRPRDGKYLVENCKVVRASGDARLDAATCTGLVAAGYDQSRARYASSYGVDRYPVKVDWINGNATMTPLPPVEVPHMPKDVVLVEEDVPPGQRPPQEHVPMELQLSSSGQVLRCEVIYSSGDDAWDAASCRLAKERGRFTSPLDWFGTPSPGTYEVTLDWGKMVIGPRW